ncbi:MAG: SDR family oxidoreductase [Candidatus Alcyoniella australis]|nr:SDR family oxidoreductase [Candidatus Alcyoniella australis]
MRQTMDYFKDKVALISGASRGVGFATAKQLLQAGAKVVISARGEQRLLKSRDELAALGPVAAVTGDVSQVQDCQAMVAAAVENFGGLDILVNNAGVSMRGRFRDLSFEVLKSVTSVNLLGSMYLTKAAIEPLIERRGHLVFISSIAGLFGVPVATAYCASKGALSGLAESLRLELHDLGVHVGVVYLGFTEHDPEKRILAADGSLVKPDRPAHHTQAQAAELIVKMLRKRKRRLIMTPAGSAGNLLHRISPRLLEEAILTAQRNEWKVYKRFS